MGLFHHHRQHEEAANMMYGDGFDPLQHEPSRVHELLAGAAAFEAMRQYEKKRAAEGHHDHSTAMEIIAAFSGAEVDRLVETKGLDFIDAERARRDASETAAQMYQTYFMQEQA